MASISFKSKLIRHLSAEHRLPNGGLSTCFFAFPIFSLYFPLFFPLFLRDFQLAVFDDTATVSERWVLLAPFASTRRAMRRMVAPGSSCPASTSCTGCASGSLWAAWIRWEKPSGSLFFLGGPLVHCIFLFFGATKSYWKGIIIDYWNDYQQISRISSQLNSLRRRWGERERERWNMICTLPLYMKILM